jgi:hypothetical protein
VIGKRGEVMRNELGKIVVLPDVTTLKRTGINNYYIKLIIQVKKLISTGGKTLINRYFFKDSTDNNAFHRLQI